MSAADQNAQPEVTLDQALELAQGHHRAGNTVIAERTYRDILRAVPGHYPTVFNLATLLAQRGDFKMAEEFSGQAIQAEPEEKGVWVNHGVILAANGKTEDALDCFNKALEIDPASTEAYSNKAYALWELKRFEEAEEMAVQALAYNPDNLDAQINLGVALGQQGKLDEAAEVWEQAAILAPDMAKIYSNWSNTLRDMGDDLEAKQKGEKAVALDENDAEAWCNYANALRDLGSFDEAEAAYRRATEIKPDFFLAHDNLALTLMEQERYDEALVAARYAVSFASEEARCHAVLSRVYIELYKFQEAYAAADRAIVLAPEEAEYRLLFVDILLKLDRSDDAEAALQQALDLAPNSPDALVKLSEVHREMDRPDDAIAAIDKALKLAPERYHLLLEKARVLQHANRVEEALVVVDRLIEQAPKAAQPWLTKVDLLLTINRKEEAGKLLEETVRPIAENLSSFYVSLTSFKKFKDESDPDFIKLKAFAEDGAKIAGGNKMNPEMKIMVYFALHDAYAQMGNYEQAFVYLKKGNDEKRKSFSYNVAGEQVALVRKKQSFTPEMIKGFEGKGCQSDVPVFIVGMPRSGTTLTEQIISSHPDVYGAGELYDLGTVVRYLGPLTEDNAEEMGRDYVERTKVRDKTGKALRITDKMPGNYNSLGLIHCILPQAKIIHCRRNPMDNLLSCYKQNFATGQYWSCDLEDLAAHYKNYADLMAYWREVLPAGSFIEIDYEETVENFEEQARRLIDYVGLPWNDACLAPHKQKRAVLTASKDQVIKPIYKTSVEAWRRYEKQLKPLADALAQHGLM